MHGLCIYCLAYKPVTRFGLSKKPESLGKVVCCKIIHNDPLSLSPNPTQFNIRVLLCQHCREGVN